MMTIVDLQAADTVKRGPLRYHKDYGDPEIKLLARAICKKFGLNPDLLEPETGYPDSALMPAWWRYQDDALKYIAMRDADKTVDGERQL